MTRTCILFDVDLTLLHSDRAGSAAMRRAFERESGVAGALEGIPFQGRTDGWIVSEVARRAGVPVARLRVRYERDYPALLREELSRREPRPLPGVADLLGALRRRPSVACCLATGNPRHAAFAKLAAVGLDGYFEGGGFGDRHERRSEMLRDAIDAIGWRRGERLVVVGDTPDDVTSAHEVGAVAVAVATGIHSEPQLAAAGADIVLPDLGDRDRALAALLG